MIKKIADTSFKDILIKLHDAMSELGVGLESGSGLEILTATEMNYHLLSQGSSDENCKLMQLDLQIIVIGWAYIDC